MRSLRLRLLGLPTSWAEEELVILARTFLSRRQVGVNQWGGGESRQKGGDALEW